MDERVLQFRVGVVVVAAVIITGILAFAFGELPTPVSRHYTIQIWFPEAPGVMADTPVRKSGILIGRVQSVKLQPLEDGGGVSVVCRMNPSYKIGPDEVCRIGSGSLFGDAVLEFTDRPAALRRHEARKVPVEVTDGAWLRGEVSENPFDVLVGMKSNLEETLTSFEDAGRSIEDAGEKVGTLADRVNSALGEDSEQVTRIMNKSELALDSFNNAMDAVNDLVDDEQLRAELKDSLHELPKLLGDTRDAVASLKNNADNLAKFTEPLGENGPELVQDMAEGIDGLRGMMTQLEDFSGRLNSRQGTIGELVNNHEIYDKLDRAATNIEDLSVKLRPIVNDVRIFTDKIARDPGRLTEGVARGAFKKNSSGTKWVRPVGWSPTRCPEQ